MYTSEIEFIAQAITEARKCKPKGPGEPLVGAVVCRDGVVIGAAHRGETGPGNHAEFGVLQKKDLRSKELLEGSTLYTTLEPCTSRSHDKLPCAGWIIRKKISKVVIGMLDPNPNICGRGYWRLTDAGVQVEFFPADRVQEVLFLNSAFVELHRRNDERVQTEFAKIVQRYKSRAVSPYSVFGWGDELSLQDSPNLREGWHLSDIELIHDAKSVFPMPERYRESYDRYFAEHREKGRFERDNKKLYLTENPIAFSDSERLILRTGSTLWSQAQFYKDEVAPIQSERTKLISETVNGSLKINFPHSFCMHMVVVTSDDKLLLTRRSPKVTYYPGTWSASVEEQLAFKDLRDGPDGVTTNWACRLLSEELGLEKKHYRTDDIRILSVFLETDILNVAVCALARLKIDSETLNLTIDGLERMDYEFTEKTFIDLQKTELLKELLQPPRPQHPSTGYRILKTLLKEFGTPDDSEIRALTAAAS